MLDCMPTSARPTPWTREVGLRLSLTREALQLTQEQLADALQVSRTALASWEIGRRLADVAAMTRLCARFGITLDWIYTGSLAHMPRDLARQIEELRTGARRFN